MKTETDRFFSKCKKCNEVYEETETYRRGFKKGKQKAHDDELEFLKELLGECPNYDDAVSVYKMIKERIKTLEEKEK